MSTVNTDLSLSIIIPVYNEASGIAGLLDHLQVYIHPEVEIIFVDGGSQDDTYTLLKQSQWQQKSRSVLPDR